MTERDLDKAALRGEPSYVWRAGQERRLEMIRHAAGERIRGLILEDGCGVGMYVEKLSALGGTVIGLEYDRERAVEARRRSAHIVNTAGEAIPLPSSLFDLILSHEVLEHVQDDRAAVQEMLRALKPGGRIALFCPNRGYPFETHGIYWRGKYKFGNIPLVNYLPRSWRNKLAPHVRVYSKPRPGETLRGLACAVYRTHGDLRRVRQHHRPLRCIRKVPALPAAMAGEDPPARAGLVPFLGGGEEINPLCA